MFSAYSTEIGNVRVVVYDTRLDASATAAALDVELPSLRAQLEQLRREFDAAR